MDFSRRVLRFGVAPLVFLSLLGARPPDPGLEISTSAGVRRTTHMRGCGAYQRVLEAPVDVRARIATPEGWTLHLEQEISPSRFELQPGQDAAADDVPEGVVLHYTSLVRGGFHARKVGVELGPMLLYRPGTDRPLFAPSALLRVGAPDVVYGYVAAFPRPPITLTQGVVEVGMGHAGPHWRGELGLNAAAARARGELPLGRGVWVGAEGIVAAPIGGGNPDWQGSLRLTLGPEVFRGASAESTR